MQNVGQLVSSFTKQIAHDLEFEEIPLPNEVGSCSLSFGKEIRIEVRVLGEGIAYFAELGECPETKREECLMYVMHANLFGIGTGRGFIGLSGKMLTFTLPSPYHTTYDLFKTDLEECVNWVDVWQKKVSDLRRA